MYQIDDIAFVQKFRYNEVLEQTIQVLNYLLCGSFFLGRNRSQNLIELLFKEYKERGAF